MNQKKKLIKNTIIIAIGRCSTQVLSFLLLPLYTSLLTTQEYGNYDLLNTISIFIIPFITLLMEEAMFRFLIDVKTEEEKAKVLSHSILFTFFNIIIGSIIMFIVGTLLKYEYTVYLIFYVIASILSTLAASVARGQSQFKLYSIFSFASGFSTVLLNILFIVGLKFGIEGLFISYIIANSLVSIWLLLKLKTYKYVSYKNFDKKLMKEMIQYSLPLVPNSISWITINLSDRIIISSVISVAANGVYSIACKFPSIINTFYSFFYIAWKESASKMVNSDEKEEFYNDIYRNLKNFLFAVSIMVLIMLPIVFGLFVKKDYLSAYTYIPILIVAIYYSNMSSFCGGIFAAYKQTKIMGTSTIYAAIINVVVNVLLIKYIGLYAAAISTFVSSFVVYLYRRVKLKKFIVLKGDNKFISNIFVLAFAIFVYYFRNNILNVVGLLLCILYCIYINKGLINELLKKFMKKKKA